MKRVYTWKPDIPDHRDHPLSLSTVALPRMVDLSQQMPPVEDQGRLGSCTGNAIAGALEFLEGKTPDKQFFDVSRLFIYYQERVIEGTVLWDEGAMIRDGVKACAKVGYCTEEKWPYMISKFDRKPPRAAYADAAKRKITEYLRASTLDDFKAALASGFPVVFGFSVYKSFESAQVAQTGDVSMPSGNDAMLGGHAVLMVGYDDDTGRVRVRNSWGTDWGDKGYFTMPYEYVADRNLSDDFWVIRK
jgi:C1A family cysteine protease